MNDNKTVLFTGLDPAAFNSLGKVIHRPAVSLVRDGNGLARLPALVRDLREEVYDHLLFSDRFAVAPFCDALQGAPLPKTLRIIAAGNGTAEKLSERGIRPDAVRVGTGTAGLLDAFHPETAGNILIIEGTHTPRDLTDAGRKRGWTMDRVAVARIEPAPIQEGPLPDHDAIFFVAPAAVRRYHEVYGETAFSREVWCMGDRVLEEVRTLGGDGIVVNPIARRAEG